MLHPIPSLQVPLAKLRPLDAAETRETLTVLSQNDYLNVNPNLDLQESHLPGSPGSVTLLRLGALQKGKHLSF